MAEYEAVSTTAVSADPAVVVPLLTINGWILMQRKITGGLVSFNKTWAQYRDGFGSATDNDNYWLGLDKVYRLVQMGSVRLRVEVDEKVACVRSSLADHINGRDYGTTLCVVSVYRRQSERYVLWLNGAS